MRQSLRMLPIAVLSMLAGCSAMEGVNVGVNVPIGGVVNVGANKTIGEQPAGNQNTPKKAEPEKEEPASEEE